MMQEWQKRRWKGLFTVRKGKVFSRQPDVAWWKVFVMESIQSVNNASPDDQDERLEKIRIKQKI